MLNPYVVPKMGALLMRPAGTVLMVSAWTTAVIVGSLALGGCGSRQGD